jgi:hypothetical protein
LSVDDLSELLQDLEAGLRVSDTRFDKVFPVEARAQAHIHWTEVATALEAVDLLTRERDEPVRILDVGSNVGKFCLVGALASRAEFVGVERRRPLVDIARTVARRLRVPRVRYQWADMESLDWSTFNGIYLYNPFQENIEPEIKIDGELELSLAQYARYVRVVQEKLAGCAPGTRVVTYYGFGGPFPEGYERSSVETQNPRLKLWVRV